MHDPADKIRLHPPSHLTPKWVILNTHNSSESNIKSTKCHSSAGNFPRLSGVEIMKIFPLHFTTRAEILGAGLEIIAMYLLPTIIISSIAPWAFGGEIIEKHDFSDALMANGRRLPPKDALSEYGRPGSKIFAMYLSLVFSYKLALIKDKTPSP